ncbi:unnamed protein product, partial [Brenthis ino]
MKELKEFIDGLFSEEAYVEPSDGQKVDDLEMKLPEWFDEKKCNQGRRFYADFSFMLSASMVAGLVAVFSIPTILNVLVSTRRSNSVYTAYRRYFSTYKHTNLWMESELKPGSESWKSLYTVRKRHFVAGRTAKLKGIGTVSQRDISLTLFGFIGFSFLKPDKFGITQLQDGDWEAYNHLWRVIGHMIGLKDKYNICRNSYEETRQVLQIILERVYTPCLENVPEYFEHSTRVMIEGLSQILTALESSSMIFVVKYLSDVPGYIYTEEDRYTFRNKLKKILKGRSEDTGVYASELMEKCLINQSAVPRQQNVFYLRDYDSVDTAPAYKNLPFIGKYKVAFNNVIVSLYSTYYGRIFFNFYHKWIVFVATYIPYLAMWKFGIRNAFVNAFQEDPVDDMTPKLNSEYYKPEPPKPWYKLLYDILW